MAARAVFLPRPLVADPGPASWEGEGFPGSSSNITHQPCRGLEQMMGAGVVVGTRPRGTLMMGCCGREYNFSWLCCGLLYSEPICTWLMGGCPYLGSWGSLQI